MSMDAEDWMRLKLPDRVRSVVPTDDGRLRGRNFIFRVFFPGVFCFVVAYHVFVHNPFVADFYCNVIMEKPHVEPVRPLPSSWPSSAQSNHLV